MKFDLEISEPVERIITQSVLLPASFNLAA
jgi:hypothetical protein